MGGVGRERVGGGREGGGREGMEWEEIVFRSVRESSV